MHRPALLLLACSMAALPARPQSPPSNQTKPSSRESTTIEGLVRDIACPIQNAEAAATKFNLDCALECARHGSPLIIQTADGTLYVPISDAMPDTDQRQKLMPFVGKYVRVTGSVFQRTGTRAIVIREIKEMRGVHLSTDLK